MVTVHSVVEWSVCVSLRCIHMCTHIVLHFISVYIHMCFIQCVLHTVCAISV